MARILLTFWPLIGHCHPAMALADGLRARGHDVGFYTGARCRTLVEAGGYPLFPFDRVEERGLEALLFARDRHLQWQWPLSFERLMRAWLIDTIPPQVEDLVAVCAKWRPDLVVSDATMFGPPLVLGERHGIDVAVCSTMIGCMLSGRDGPVWGIGMRPATGWLTRQRARIALKLVDVLAFRFRRAANAVRARHRLPPLATPILEHLARMPLCLVRGSPELDYGRQDLPPGLRYAGTLTWEGPGDAGAPAPWRGQLVGREPLVHVTEGSMGTGSPTVLRAAAEGLGGMAISVVMTAGSHRDPARLGLGPLASNVSVSSWIPHQQLLPAARAVVTVGGAGTILAALEAGVPLVVVPAESDQIDNAQRVVWAGAGVQLPRRRCTADRLRRAVMRVLEDQTYASHAQRLAAQLADYKGATRAVDAIEHHLTTSGGRHG